MNGAIRIGGAVVLLAAWTGAAVGQSLPASPTPVAPAGPAGAVLGAPQNVPPPPPPPPPLAPQPAVLAPALPPPAEPAPARDGFNLIGLPARPEGLFFDADLEVLKPTIHNSLSGSVEFLGGSTNAINIPQSSLDWTVAPRLEVGYRLPDNEGAFLIGYRFLLSSGTSSDYFGANAYDVKSRLTLNQVDLDYQSIRYSPLARYTLQYRLGARIAALYYDSTAQNEFDYQRASNYFAAAGPHAQLDFERQFTAIPELSLLGRIDGAVLFGPIQQRFAENLSDGGGVLSGETTDRKNETAPTLTLQFGVNYRPLGPTREDLKISLGYQFEEWWSVGKIGDSRGDFMAQGFYLRGEWDF
jgi:hypothetical protein